MKKIISIIISLLIVIPSMQPLAYSRLEDDNIYNYMIENGTSLGVDNISNDLNNASENLDNGNGPLMSNGVSKTINNIVVLIRFKGEN